MSQRSAWCRGSRLSMLLIYVLGVQQQVIIPPKSGPTSGLTGNTGTTSSPRPSSLSVAQGRAGPCQSVSCHWLSGCQRSERWTQAIREELMCLSGLRLMVGHLDGVSDLRLHVRGKRDVQVLT